MTEFNSTDDQRTQSNRMRHQYRTLSDAEKAAVDALKLAGSELAMSIGQLGSDREFEIARERIEEGIMWAVKGVTK
ncbi:MAG: hypothetical protein AAGH43_06125 [Pseudomonadota bacterium]